MLESKFVLIAKFEYNLHAKSPTIAARCITLSNLFSKNDYDHTPIRLELVLKQHKTDTSN